MRFRIISLIVVACLTAGLVTPIIASATSTESDYSSYGVEQLEALITKLQKRLAELKQTSKCFVTESDLSLGDGEDETTSKDVRRLQDFLREKGHFAYKSTGYFGKVTKASLLAFQKAVGVSLTGEFDAATRAKAHALYCKAVTTATKSKSEAKSLESKAEGKETKSSPVAAIKLMAVEGGKVSWTADGRSAQGFKVVWSKTSGPTYPCRESDKYQYYSDPGATKTELEAFSGDGTYYVRVCEYLGGKCGVYSNEIAVQLAD